MATFLMLGKYSPQGMTGIGPERTVQATGLLDGLGGKIHSIHALLGDHDLVLLVELPDAETAIRASMDLGGLLGASFTTSPALPASDFDRVVTGR